MIYFPDLTCHPGCFCGDDIDEHHPVSSLFGRTDKNFSHRTSHSEPAYVRASKSASVPDLKSGVTTIEQLRRTGNAFTNVTQVLRLSHCMSPLLPIKATVPLREYIITNQGVQPCRQQQYA